MFDFLAPLLNVLIFIIDNFIIIVLSALILAFVALKKFGAKRTGKLVLKVLAGIILLIVVYLLFGLWQARNPYAGKEMAPASLQGNDNYVTSINWTEHHRYTEFAYPEHADRLKSELPYEMTVFFTNIMFVDEDDYQFAQVGGNLWGDDQKLFWRQNSQSVWNEIKVDKEYIKTRGFIKIEGRMYIVAEVGLSGGQIYTINLDSGKFERRIKRANGGVAVAPDKQKIAYIDSHGFCDDVHTILIWDIEADKNMPVSTLQESDPCSGRSFGVRWSMDSNHLEIEGSAYEQHKFAHIYDHKEAKLYDLDFSYLDDER